jgi:uncharacterized membrane protein YfcA
MSLALILATFAGFFLGLLGTGGSMLVLPILVYIAHLPPHQAVGMSLLIVGTTCALGCLFNMRRGLVELRVGAVFAVTGITGAWIGAQFTHLVPSRVLLMSFAVLMIVIGGKMLTQPMIPSWNPGKSLLRCLVAGAVVGILTGFLGVGGGFIVLPALVLFGGLEMKAAVATSLGIIALNCFAGLGSQLWYVRLDLPLALGFVVAASAGMAGGLALADHVASTSLRKAFGLNVIILGAILLIENAT